MTVAKSPQFRSFEAYLSADPCDLPEGRYEYWDGELVPVVSESFDNGTIAVGLLLALVAIGVPFELIKTHFCEVEVPGRPRSRFPDLVVVDESHVSLLKRRATITQKMHPLDSWLRSFPLVMRVRRIISGIMLKSLFSMRRSGCLNIGLSIPIAM
jgi:Uma2 family endonuclease